MAARLESKLNRSVRFLKRYTDEGSELIAQNAATITNVTEIADQVDLLCAGLEDEVKNLESLIDAYELEISGSDNGPSDDQTNFVDRIAETAFEAKHLLRKLYLLKRKLLKLQDVHSQLSRSVSYGSVTERGSLDTTQRTESDVQPQQQSPHHNSSSEVGNHADAMNDLQSQFWDEQSAVMGDVRPNVSENVQSAIPNGVSSGIPNVSSVMPGNGQMNDETVRMLCQTIMQLTNAQQHQSTAASGASYLKLPKHNLPKFSKGPELWQSFWDQFDKAVDRHQNLANVEKMQYLKGCLEGDAAKLVAGLPLSNDNYQVAVSLLKDRFGNPNVAIEKIYAKMIDMPMVPPRECKKLRDFCFDLENSLRQLEALGADSKSDHLVGVVLRKLPRYLVSQLERSKGPRQQWCMQLLRALLADELEIAEATYMRDEKPDSDDKRNGIGGKDNGKSGAKGRSTAGSFKAQDEKGSRRTGNDGKKPKCFFCAGEHWSNDCKKQDTAEKRREVVRNLNRCFICFANHLAKHCKSEKPCYHCKKARMHHASLCPDKYSAAARSREQAKNGDEKGEDLTDQQRDIGGLASDEYAIMKTAICEVLNPDDDSVSVKNVRVFLDSGTSRSLMTVARARQLKLTLSRKKRLLVNRFADDGEPKSIEMQEAKITLKTRSGRKIKIAVAVTPKALGSVTLAAKSKIERQIPTGLTLADEIRSRDTKTEIDIMIGNDYYDDLVYSDRVSLSPGLWLISSAFGWVLSGRMSNRSQKGSSSDTGMFILPYAQTEFPELPDEADIKQAVRLKDFRIENMWNLESIGIKDEPNEVTDDFAIEQFNKTVKFEDGRYQVTWPYKQNADSLPENDDIALQRLKSMLSRLQKQNKFDFLQKYDTIINDQMESGVIEEVHAAEVISENKIHYLAHHGVEKPDRATTKIRIVYNASYRRNPDTPSLNDCLYRGQVFVENLVILLIRFRLHPVAVIGDLEKAFLKVGLQPDQRDVTRFFWVRDVRKPVQEDNLVIYRFTRVSFGVKSSPFLLGATVAYHLKQQNSETARQIEQDLYVDNLVTGVDNVDDAKKLYHESKKIFHAANMNIREFGSNDAEFNKLIPDVDAAARNPVKVLGVDWDKESDTFAPRSYSSRNVKNWSKKLILSVLFQIYDPLGLVCPVLLPGKVLLQKLNKKGVHWDEKMPPEVETQWQKILSELASLDTVKINRYLGFKLNQCDRLMIYCDASADAYAAIVYMQKIDADEPKSHLIFAKSRVSPMKGMTIPRLELMAVVLGVRMLKFLRQHLPFAGKCIVWSNSQCVLRWIPDHTVTGVFVQNRLKEIRKAENVQFRYVPTKENPSDIASRGCPVSELGQMWWHGPAWSMKAEYEWPKWEGNFDSDSLKVELEETFAADPIDESNGPFGINMNAYSSCKRLFRVTSYCIRFVGALKGNRTKSKFLTPMELQKAEVLWIKFVQKLGYSDLISDINKGKKNTTQQQLGVQADNGNILRCHGRLSLLNAVDDTKFPILLPKHSQLTKLIIADCHARSMHAGTAQTLAAVRNRFWIPHGRARVKAFVKHCTTCRYFEGKAFGRPKMPELPEVRVSRDRPFRNVGLDYFGPLYTKNENGEQKRWVCLITCLVTRAVHLEMVNDLSSDEFLLALRRFMARRGKCDNILSDNATQFKAVDRSKVLNETLAGEAIVWKFIPEMTPWAGGVYERLVRSVKTAIKKSLRNALLNDMQLQTILTEVENCVNSRPLTYLTDDIDSWKPITPNDLLGIESQKTVSFDFEDRNDKDYRQCPENTRERMVKLYKSQLNQLEDVWKVWQKDYLLSLRETLRYDHKDPHGKIQREPRLGEIVIINDERLNRGRWKIGKVQEKKVSADGKIRAVKVKLSNGHVLTRPVSLLHPVEIEFKDDDTSDPNEQLEEQEGGRTRTKRKAAKEAVKKIRDIFDEESEDDDEAADLPPECDE